MVKDLKHKTLTRLVKGVVPDAEKLIVDLSGIFNDYERSLLTSKDMKVTITDAFLHEVKYRKMTIDFVQRFTDDTLAMHLMCGTLNSMYEVFWS